MPEENPTIGPRTRFYDYLVIEAVRDGLGQVVLLAAGMDTRAFRLPLAAEVIVFELDLPKLLAQKQAILEQEHAEPRCQRVVVAADLAEDGWSRALTTSGFDPAARAVFVAEGLSWYLTEDENARLLEDLASLAAPERRLGIDIVSRDALENPAAAPFFEFTAALRIRWQFGTNDPAGFLAAHGRPKWVTSTPLPGGLAAGHRPVFPRTSTLAPPPRAAATSSAPNTPRQNRGPCFAEATIHSATSVAALTCAASRVRSGWRLGRACRADDSRPAFRAK